MNLIFEHPLGKFKVSLDNFYDLSIPLSREKGVEAFSIPPIQYSPFRTGTFLGSVREGGSCNCETLVLNPHGNGTHTEGMGHITAERIPLFRCLREVFFLCRLISLEPDLTEQGHRMVSLKQIEKALGEEKIPESLILRTLPNGPEKLHRKYSGTHPPYIQPEGAAFLAHRGVNHLLVDLPSVDPEEDGGKLLAHRAFWQYPENPRRGSTITEMVYVEEKVEDGDYLLNLQIIPLESDASPSRPLLFNLEN